MTSFLSCLPPAPVSAAQTPPVGPCPSPARPTRRSHGAAWACLAGALLLAPGAWAQGDPAFPAPQGRQIPGKSTAYTPLGTAVAAQRVAATTTLTFFSNNQGWFSPQVGHIPNDNYLVGFSSFSRKTYRNFFSFPLTGLNLTGKQIVGASLSVADDGRNEDPVQSVTYVLHDVSTPRATLAAAASAGSAVTMSVFNDLGTGTIYGTYATSTAVTRGQRVFALAPAAWADIAARAGSDFAVGGRVPEAEAGLAAYLFGFTGATTTQILTVELADAQSIATGALAAAVCAGGPLTVPFTTAGTFGAGNTFTAQLSNAAGGFAAPLAIGTLAGPAAGTIAATVPAGTPAGTGYRVRVVGSDPAVTGTDNGSDVTVNALPTPSAATSLGTIFLGYGPQTATLTAAGGATYAWAANRTPSYLSGTTGASVVFAPQTGGTYTFTVTATSAAGCSASASVAVVVNDVRCGNGLDKVAVCHNGNRLCVGAPSVAAHLAHGDALGDCPPGAAARGTGANELAVYPNPAAETAAVAFRPAATGTARVEVYNHFGQRVATLYEGAVNGGQHYDLRLDSHALAAGMYVCRLVLNGRAETRQLNIAR